MAPARAAGSNNHDEHDDHESSWLRDRRDLVGLGNFQELDFEDERRIGRNSRRAARRSIGQLRRQHEASQAADPSAYSRVTFEIEEYADMVRLTVTHDELEAGSGMAIGISKGWPVVLASLKSLLETGEGLDVFAKPKSA